MTYTVKFSKILLLVFISLALVWTHGSAADQANESPQGKSQGRFVTIDFNNVDIGVFIKFISELTGKNFVVDSRVRGNVTIISPTRVSINEAYKVFESVLEVHGYTAVEAGKVIKIVPSPDARTKSIETKLKEEAAAPEDKVVTQLVRLKYADPDNIKKVFAPLVSKNSVILSYPPTSMLIVTDVYSNIKRLSKIINAIDIAGVGREISIVPLKNAEAKNLVKIVETIFKPVGKKKKDAADDEVKLVADERTNTLVVFASEDNTKRISALIQMLDKEVPRGKENIRVYYLEHATAEELVKVLQELPQKEKAQTQGKKTAPVVSEKVKITADKATNSLIITAEKDDYLVIEQVIRKLDIPRSMVYIESLIMEVDVEKDFTLGTEWIAMGKINYGDQAGALGGGFSGADPGYTNTGNVLAGTLPAGFSLGTFSEVISIGGVQFPNIAAIVQAYKRDKDIHILSTPQILTTDNQEAKITVGKNVPFQTRSAATNATETYSSFEYRDVGVTLKITPQISKDRMVRLIISHELTKLDELATTNTDRPTTLKRTIDTTVIVKDGNTVVIGGLIDDIITATEYKVPCLGDVPALGWLFKTVSDSSEKTNLYVFITPRVINSPDEAQSVYDKKKDEIDAIEKGHIKMYDADPLRATPRQPMEENEKKSN